MPNTVASSYAKQCPMSNSVAALTVQYSTVLYSTVLYCTVQYSTVLYSTVQYSTVQLIKQLSQPQAFQAGLKGFPTHYTILEVNVSYSWYILLSCAKVPLGSTDLQQTVTNLFGFG